MSEYDFITYIAQPFVVVLMIIFPFAFFYMINRVKNEKENINKSWDDLAEYLDKLVKEYKNDH